MLLMDDYHEVCPLLFDSSYDKVLRHSLNARFVVGSKYNVLVQWYKIRIVIKHQAVSIGVTTASFKSMWCVQNRSS